MYSNSIASASNILYVAISKDMQKLDVGGLLTTLYHLISDYKIIKEINAEFLSESFQEMVLGSKDYMKSDIS